MELIKVLRIKVNIDLLKKLQELVNINYLVNLVIMKLDKNDIL